MMRYNSWSWKWLLVVALALTASGNETLESAPTSDVPPSSNVEEHQNDVASAPKEIDVGLWDPEIFSDPLEVKDEHPTNDMNSSESVLYPRVVPPRPYLPTPKVVPQVSPWSIAPGHYTRESYGGPRYPASNYNRHAVYASYLGSPSLASYAKQCLRSYGQTPRLSTLDLKNAFNYASQSMALYVQSEKNEYKSGNYINLTTYSPMARHQIGPYRPRGAPASPVYQKEKEALFNEFAAQYLVNNYCLSKAQVQYMLPNLKIGPRTGNPYSGTSCYAAYGSSAEKLRCADSPYRTYDGSCNNLYHPYWGKAFTCHLRLAPANYADGVSKPIYKSVTGAPMPNPRMMSSLAHAPRPDKSFYTHLFMAWGQYLNHDLILTPQSTADYQGGALKCCPTSHHPQCMAIKIPPNDYVNGRYKKSCMNFVRSAACPLCSLTSREQTNSVTSFMDQSAVYGSSHEEAMNLRSYQYGLLKVGRDKCGREILPPTDRPWESQCHSKIGPPRCMAAGDVRNNQNPPLQVLHVLWLRMHNINARGLYKVNPTWNDERIFQVARVITIAQWQHMTYHEYLAVLMGPQLLKYFDLEVTYGTGYSRYEPYTDPTTWNEYSLVGRYGHTSIRSFSSMLGYGGNSSQYMKYAGRGATKPGFWMRDWFFDTTLVQDCASDAIILGLLNDNAMNTNPSVDVDLHDYLYRAPHEQFGLDLAAINYYRGRDHGLAPYYVYLDFCFGYKAKSWEDLGKFIPYEQLVIFKKLYPSWRDVELWPATISERKYPDADIGPTAACIVGIQFYHAKFGDRYFYSHGHQAGSLTPAQLSNIKQVTTVSSFLCQTGDYLQGVQKYAFFPISRNNPVVPCNRQPRIDYNLWKDVRGRY